jgi:alanine-synthesizing transaminase
MFSSRLAWDQSTNPLLSLVAAKRAAGQAILDLTGSNPTRVGFTYPEDQILTALAHPASAVYQPSPQGLPLARAAVAAYYQDRGLVVDPDSLLLTASTSEAYSFLFKLLCNPGDEVLVPQPGYPLFDFLTALDSVQPISYALTDEAEAGWQINFERLEAALGPRTRAIIVVSPHNPTGAVITPAELARLNTLCRTHHLALIVDEVFADYAPAQSASAVNNPDVLTFALNGLSKVAALPQAKLGWMQVSGPPDLCKAALARLEFIADTYLSVSASIQHAAPTLLATRHNIQTQIRKRLTENETWLHAQATANARVLQRAGGWYGLLEFHDSLSDEDRAQQLLEKHNVLVHPGYFYDFAREGYVVVSLLTPPDIFQAGIQHLLAEWG